MGQFVSNDVLKISGENRNAKYKEEKVIVEVWKDIKGYEGYYQVSNYGRIKSLARPIYKKDGSFYRFKRETIKSNKTTSDGYYSITLSVNGHDVTKAVHILVAEAFVTKPCSDIPLEVNHIDTDRKNNYYKNLEWVTHRDNVLHSASLGRYQRYGDRNPNYNKHTLHDYYKAHPEDKQLLARHGSDNGTARAVTITSDSETIEFGFIRECAEWFKDRYQIKYKVATVHQHLINHNRSRQPYYGYTITIAPCTCQSITKLSESA